MGASSTVLKLALSGALGVALAACNKDDKTTVPPDLNYIPGNTNACDPATDAEATLAAATLAARLEANPDWFAALDFEVCSEAEVQISTCTPCSEADNPLLAGLRAADTLGTAEVQIALTDGTVPAESLEAYFRQALAYEWRDLVMSAGADGTVTLAQAVRRDCTSGDGLCGDLATESLTPECDAFSHELPGTSSTSDGTLNVTSQAGSEIFDFVVPLMTDLPAASSFGSDSELRAYLESQPVNTYFLNSPQVEWSISTSTDDGCGQLVGYIPASDFSGWVGDPSALAALETDRPGYIKAVLTLGVQPIDLSSGGAR
jgi:hypothetical protein